MWSFVGDGIFSSFAMAENHVNRWVARIGTLWFFVGCERMGKIQGGLKFAANGV